MSEGKRYYWLKLHDDFFTSKRIKKLRKISGGDTFTIIYLKMQLMAIKSEGVLKFTGLEDNFADELALDLDEEPDDVRITLTYLLSCGLAETSDDVNFFFPYAITNTGSEGASAQRMRECRERQKASLCDTKALQSDTPVTHVKRFGDGEKEKEIEIDTRDRTGDGRISFDISDEEIQASLNRDKSIEDACRDYGLPCEAGHMIHARDLADQYTLEWLLKAIEISGGNKSIASWRYVEGVLRKAKERGGIEKPAPAPAKPAKVMNGNNYEQRNYTQDEIQRAAMRAWAHVDDDWG